MTKSWSISRRTMLRGIGVAMALPLLDVMAHADDLLPISTSHFTPTKKPVRILMMNMPCGTYHKEWEPTVAGTLGELPPMLSPLQAHAADVVVMNNLWNKAAAADPIAHYANEANLYTGTVVKKTTGVDLNVGGVSMDQVLARHLGAVTRIPSLHLNMQKPNGGVDSGWARVYNSHLSWSSPTTPVPNEVDPQRAFARLFRVYDKSTTIPVISDADKISVLDYVQDEAKSIIQKVSIADKRKMDAYLTSVRDVEVQISREMKALESDNELDPASSKALGELSGKLIAFDGKDHTKRTRLMLDVALLAFQTDLTRVATFMFGNERNDINYSFIDGVNTSHHGASHHTESADKLKQYREICLWHATQVAYVLERMKAIDDGQGATLLDNSMVFWGGALSDGNSHGRPNLPIMLAGKGGGTINTGRFIKLPEKTPLCNLYLSMFQRMGLQAPSFADSTGIINELAS